MVTHMMGYDENLQDGPQGCGQVLMYIPSEIDGLFGQPFKAVRGQVYTIIHGEL